MTLNYSRLLKACQALLLVLPIVTINEVAWMGTKTSYDEWIELSNNTDSSINLDGWILQAADGVPKIKLAGSILANGFNLLERSKDYTGALNNKGEKLELFDSSGNLIDSADASLGWPAGDNTTKQTMSRLDLNQWKSSKEPGGTPGALNIFATDIVEVKEASPPPIEAKPQTFEPQINTGLVAALEPVTQKSSFFLLIAGALAIFSGIIILVLKRKLK